MREHFTPRIRRIVTGHDPAGKAVVWLDGPATNQKMADDKVSSTVMWVTDAAPTDYSGNEDAGARHTGTAPPSCGTRFGILELLPGNSFHGLHRTDTVDYCICLSGEIEMVLDEDRVMLNSGDVVIQRGTNHAWLNRGSQPARLAFVLVDGAPKRDGSLAGNDQAIPKRTP